MPPPRDLWPPALAVAGWWLVAGAVSAGAEVADPAGTWLLLANLALAVPALAGAVYAIGRQLGGRPLGAWFVLALVALPPASLAYALGPYRDVYIDRVLATALGLTDDALLAAGAASAVGAALLLGALEGRRSLAALGGLAAGLGLLLEPTAALFLVGAALAFAVARRPLEAGMFAAAVLPFVAVALIRDGLAFSASWDAFSANMAGLREHLWSNRVLQWLPLAGIIGLARRSLPAAVLAGGWFGGFAVVVGASPDFEVGDGSYLVAFVPVLPALALFVAALPLLVPGLPARLDDRLATLGRG